MEVQMLSTKLIKPSSPTPSHLRTLKLSPVDQLFTYTVKPSAICYYSAGRRSSSSSRSEDDERRNRLETSLSETLTRFYPLAGRYIKDSHSVDCNDQGVEYMEAKVEGQLSQLLSRRDEMIYQLVHLSGGESTSPIASIQITRFDCGGLVIGVRIHHIVVDGFTAASFVSAWATASRDGIGKLIFPTFGLTSFFPENDLPAMKPRPPQKRTDKVVTRRFVFDGATISSLKARANDPRFQRDPSRVEVVTALIWRALMGVRQAKHGRLRTSLASLSMNLRPKIVPPLPPLCCGNLLARTAARFMAEDSSGELPDFKDLVGLLRDAFKKFKETVLAREDVYSTVINSRNELHEAMAKEEVDVFVFTSWSRLPFYEADFGWGKPVWVSKIHFPAEQIFLLDSESGDGIEAWVGLNKQDMLQLQQDADILAFTSSV